MVRIGSGALLFFFAAASMCLGQGAPLGPDDVVTGQCQGHGAEPGCVLPNLFGSMGLTLTNNNTTFTHFAHFVGSAQTTLNQTLSTAIATQLAILPIISPSSGFTYKYDSAAGAFVRTTTNFGPIYTERAETIGRGKVSFGVSYQRFRFGRLDGIDLHNVPAVFSHVPNTGEFNNQPTPEPYEKDVIETSNNINLNLDQTMLYGTVGITDRLDVSVAIPIVSVRMAASSNANIIRVSGQTFIPTGTTTPRPNPHKFPNGTLMNTYTSNGNASGIGDVTIRFKASVLRTERVRVALALDVRPPSGNAREFLGSGATGIKPFVAISIGKRFSPHVNLGYQWNGQSILAGNVTGTNITDQVNPKTQTEATFIQRGPATKQNLPRQVLYSLGADLGVTKNLTLSFDYLGQAVLHAPRVFESRFITQSFADNSGAHVYPNIYPGKDTIGLNSGAAGLKYNLFNRLLLTADLLFRMDNRGLRQNVTPLIALSYAFGQ